jgi:ABC-type phosphate transport system substrate-binding protein
MQAPIRQNRYRVVVPTLLAFVLAWPVGASELVVVAGTHSPVSRLSREQVADIYLGRVTTLPGGTSAQPLDLPASSPEREAFYNQLTGKSAAQVKAYWAKMSFTGKGVPPKQLPSSAELKKFASGKPGAIGYIEEDAVDGSVKVLCPLK